MEFLYNQISLLLQNNQFLSGGLFLGLFSVIAYKFRDIGLFIWNKIKILTIFSVYIDDKNNPMHVQFANWFKEHYPTKFRSTEASNSISFDLLTGKYYSKLNLKQFSDSNLIWYKNRLILVNKQRETFQSANDQSNFYINKYIIKGFLAKEAILDLMLEVGDFEIRVKQNKNRLGIHNYYNYWEELYQEKCIIKSFDKLYFPNKQEIIDKLDNFKINFNKYLDLGLSHKTSMLLYGPPGTGKSSICTAIAGYLNYPIYNLNLSAIEKDSDLEKAISYIPSRSILLLEDIDRCLPANDEKAKYNIRTLLNCLDGSSSLNHCVVLMTTNFIENLDDALIRSGRVDHKIEIGYPNKENVEEFLTRFYKKEIKVNNLDPTKTMSDIQSIALSSSIEETLAKIEVNKSMSAIN